jgi:hypothetical protein
MKLSDFIGARTFPKGRFEVWSFPDPPKKKPETAEEAPRPEPGQPGAPGAPAPSRPAAGAVPTKAAARPPAVEVAQRLLRFEVPVGDEPTTRRVPSSLEVPADLGRADAKLVYSALTRAGVQHLGLQAAQLVRLHQAVQRERHVELFADINALTTGLVSHLAMSLGPGLGRIVVSSSLIDVLHEYQSALKRKRPHDFRRKRELARALRMLDELRETVPVHIHQLPPGASRYFQRKGGVVPNDHVEPRDDDDDVGEGTYVSEDRQMVSAFWDYLSRSNPRLPAYMVTSDFALAHVCAAERVAFVFAPTPYEAQLNAGGSHDLRTLWFDPYALALRACPPHRILWELCMVYGRLNVLKVDNSSGAGGGGGGASDPLNDPDSFSLTHDTRLQYPGSPSDLTSGRPLTAPPVAEPSAKQARPSKQVRPAAHDEREPLLQVRLATILEVLPTRPGQQIDVSEFKSNHEHRQRQWRQIGDATGLFEVTETAVRSGPALPDLLAALKKRDYMAVNAIFRRVRTYDSVLREVEGGAPFPPSSKAGAVTGWAVSLGAAYKSAQLGTLYGLAEVADAVFEEHVLRFHREVGGGQPAAPIPEIVHKLCIALRISPIRVEAMLNRMLGHGALALYEAQRATVEGDLPGHPVLVFPTSAKPESYLREFQPARGILVDGKLMGSLVRRPPG